MLDITGVGKYKLEHYGPRFLKVLQDSTIGEETPRPR